MEPTDEDYALKRSPKKRSCSVPALLVWMTRKARLKRYSEASDLSSFTQYDSQVDFRSRRLYPDHHVLTQKSLPGMS